MAAKTGTEGCGALLIRAYRSVGYGLDDYFERHLVRCVFEIT
jgi:hypothetical protein